MTRLNDKVVSYVETESIELCDAATVRALKEALIDIVGCTVAGGQAPAAAMTRMFAIRQWGRGDCTLFLAAERLSPAGAALVNATLANSLDLDDGHRLVKGHPGAVVFPAALAAAEDAGADGRQFLSALLVGYEVGIRAGMLAHRLRPEYHCTGSWGALGAAAAAACLLGLKGRQIEHALGVAEYHSTYSPMMRCIDTPSMVKDGIGWGSMTGISSAYLAAEGFTGIPSLFTLEDTTSLTDELGGSYRIHQLYYKPHACCRWAQPAVEAIDDMMRQHRLPYREIEAMIIYTFAESARLQQTPPASTEEAQYHLFFPAACRLVFGEVGPEQVLHELRNPEVLKLMGKMEAQVDPGLNREFPQKALSRVEIRTTDGARYVSDVKQAKGDYDFPLTAEQKKGKFMKLTVPVLGQERSAELLDTLERIEELDSLRRLTALIAASAR
ncbi:MmgE/PrpD family protein [Gordoniibacillus kamchatkensis]|uniref:MmgE/PrpD family protein n=1 Tax=Gordoniibacillus kamchatkensis TaxID=1590651 RepID=UPI000698A3F3|nr:MmgE/PrpD family protein [Paenibacillus sp. VKM B-2647]